MHKTKIVPTKGEYFSSVVIPIVIDTVWLVLGLVAVLDAGLFKWLKFVLIPRGQYTNWLVTNFYAELAVGLVLIIFSITSYSRGVKIENEAD